jgi:hypothetical protein
MQEFIEAALLLHFCDHKSLMSKSDLEESLYASCGHPFPIEPIDFCFGIADLT